MNQASGNDRNQIPFKAAKQAKLRDRHPTGVSQIIKQIAKISDFVQVAYAVAKRSLLGEKKLWNTKTFL